MLNNPSTRLNCEKCLGGHFGNCVKGKCIHGSTAKSLVGATEAVFWNKKGTYKYLDKIICCSEFMKSKMDTNPIFAEKTVAKHNFIEQVNDNASNIASDNRVLSDGTTLPSNYVLYFGRYSWEKGMGTLLNACEMLPEVDFVFAGKGEYADAIANLQYAKDVGFRTGDDLDKLISGASFTIYPSEWYENNPFSVMESQQRLVPVIGANIGGIPELIHNREDGLLFESGDSKGLADAIKYLWDNPEAVQYFKENLKETIKTRQSADEYADWIVEKVYGNRKD